MSCSSGHWHPEGDRRVVHAPTWFQRVANRPSHPFHVALLWSCCSLNPNIASQRLPAPKQAANESSRSFEITSQWSSSPSDNLHCTLMSRPSDHPPKSAQRAISSIPYRVPAIVTFSIQKSRPTDHQRSTFHIRIPVTTPNDWPLHHPVHSISPPVTVSSHTHPSHLSDYPRTKGERQSIPSIRNSNDVSTCAPTWRLSPTRALPHPNVCMHPRSGRRVPPVHFNIAFQYSLPPTFQRPIPAATHLPVAS